VAGESHATAQIILSSVKLCLTVSNDGCSHVVCSDNPLHLFNICYESKNLYCIKLHFHALYALFVTGQVSMLGTWTPLREYVVSPKRNRTFE